jgi:hypothetical protein
MPELPMPFQGILPRALAKEGQFTFDVQNAWGSFDSI